MTAGRQAVSSTKDWCTPPEIIESVRKCFGGSIGLDPCSNQYSTVGADTEYRLPDRDGLVEPWDALTIYVNPPYGSDIERGTRISHWFARISEAFARGSQVIALVPVAPNTRHWKQFVFPEAAAVCFLYAPRLRFFIAGNRDPKGAPMSCAVIYWGEDRHSFAEAFGPHGAVVALPAVARPEQDARLF